MIASNMSEFMKKKRGGRFLPVWMTLVMIATFSVKAHQFIPLSIETLIEQSHWVVQGRVVQKSCHWDEHGSIFTRITLDQVDVWKGESSGDTFTFIQAGGTLGDVQMVATGEPNYKLREEVVVFLSRNQRGEGVSVGMAQGKFKTWLRESDQELMAFNLFHGAPDPEVNSGSAASSWEKAVQKANGLTVTDLKEQVQAYEK